MVRQASTLLSTFLIEYIIAHSTTFPTHTGEHFGGGVIMTEQGHDVMGHQRPCNCGICGCVTTDVPRERIEQGRTRHTNLITYSDIVGTRPSFP